MLPLIKDVDSKEEITDADMEEFMNAKDEDFNFGRCEGWDD